MESHLRCIEHFGGCGQNGEQKCLEKAKATALY